MCAARCYNQALLDDEMEGVGADASLKGFEAK